MGNISNRLEELGLTLPPAPKPVAVYVPALRFENLLYISGQLPMQDGKVAYTGKVGQDVTVEDAYQAARICTLNALSIARDVLGHLDWIAQIVKVGGFVHSAPGFTSQPQVINGASELLGDIFGDKGQHARAAVGVNELPLNAAVEVEFVIGIAD